MRAALPSRLRKDILLHERRDQPQRHHEGDPGGSDPSGPGAIELGVLRVDVAGDRATAHGEGRNDRVLARVGLYQGLDDPHLGRRPRVDRHLLLLAAAFGGRRRHRRLCELVPLRRLRRRFLRGLGRLPRVHRGLQCGLRGLVARDLFGLVHDAARLWGGLVDRGLRPLLLLRLRQAGLRQQGRRVTCEGMFACIAARHGVWRARRGANLATPR
mmetsp:Transcript_67648/g.195852  ORF Transcript_67648/g.195852 Transcript_67648/m.195852 type:complete len:214 (-) Transcript_67648:19-660(-)